MPELKRTILRLGAESAGSSLLAPFFGYVLLNDLTVRDDAAHHKIIYKNRTLLYLYGALKNAITADLTIRLNAIVGGTKHEVGTFTIPATTDLDVVLEWSGADFSWTNCPHKSTLSMDITAGDGSKDVYGIAEFLLVFSPSDSGGSAPSTSPGSVTNTSGNLTADEPVFGAGGVDVKVGSRSGNTTAVVTTSGTHPAGNLGVWDASGNLVSGGPPPAAVTPSNATPTADSGAGAAGTSAEYARGDHAHPLAAGSVIAGQFSGSGDYLKSDGTRGTPSGGGGSGALVLLEQHTASGSATLDFTACISASYDEYEIHFIGIVPASTNVSFQMRMSTNGGSTYDAGAAVYKYGMLYSGIGDVPTQSTGNGVSAIDLAHSISTQANYSTNGKITLYSPGGAGYKFINGKVQSVVGAGNVYQWGDSGVYLSTTAVNAFRFLFSSGNIASGTIRVYGVAK